MKFPCEILVPSCSLVPGPAPEVLRSEAGPREPALWSDVGEGVKCLWRSGHPAANTDCIWLCRCGRARHALHGLLTDFAATVADTTTASALTFASTVASAAASATTSSARATTTLTTTLSASATALSRWF